MDPMQVLLSQLMSFGDAEMPVSLLHFDLPYTAYSLQATLRLLLLQTLKVMEETMSAFLKHIKRELRTNPKAVRSMFIKCAVQLSTKMPLYSLIIGTKG